MVKNAILKKVSIIFSATLLVALLVIVATA